MNKTEQRRNDYEGFVEKFKPKKTTDDCYTPHLVYDAILKWVKERYNIADTTRVIRPFYPGGDYQSEDYSGDCIVIDNPPFSILAKILRWYQEQGVRFFLFAPASDTFLPYVYRRSYSCRHRCYYHIREWGKRKNIVYYQP